MATLLIALAVALVLFGVAVAVIRRESVLAPAPPDESSVGLPPERPPRALDVERLTFGMAFRGYRMTEVDDALDRLRDTLAAYEEELHRLRGASGDRRLADEDSPAPEAPPRQLSGRDS